MTCLDPTAVAEVSPSKPPVAGYIPSPTTSIPVAWLILKATVEFPASTGNLLRRYQQLASEFIRRRDERLEPFIPAEPLPNSIATNWLWSRTITCPYCGGLVPLVSQLAARQQGDGSPPGAAHRRPGAPALHVRNRHKGQGPQPWHGEAGGRPLPLSRLRPGDRRRRGQDQAQAGKMGQQLYAVVYKQTVKTGTTKAGKDKLKSVRGFRAPRPEDDVSAQVEAALDGQDGLNGRRGTSIPTERFLTAIAAICGTASTNMASTTGPTSSPPANSSAIAPASRSSTNWSRRFANSNRGNHPRPGQGALAYLAIAMDKMLNYNSHQSRLDANARGRGRRLQSARFRFPVELLLRWLRPSRLGYDWAIEQTGKALEELIELRRSRPATSRCSHRHHEPEVYPGHARLR